MAHHRDPNVPLRLDAATLFEFEHDEEIVSLNARIADLSRRIAGQPSIHKSLAEERSRLYTQKAKKLRAKRSDGGMNAMKNTSLGRDSLNVYHADAAEGSGIAQGDFIRGFQFPYWVQLDNLGPTHQTTVCRVIQTGSS
ncbi:uncharacterized protein NFIA_092520 [Aspergillus fischeri NRRL 181]|uniref:Uncharacterized protein n=1 Tax=Neosartorya fischeri (strain ATCC 1020 / DSM 3700 / CBS 544.65 / FGSC A1164 / JCM 1740 / NRRL 181 / WB 181) TaxID=331117 RepID=A1DIT4_NEOFI|nr:uncharacterized protein NFIA_092520 [Aspergillus fischeri NRRL 181]EAW19291.1 hypothetical protein NFIA_092520 [Aspergillus fischeri NRRL 181]KAG2010921.1 hypothetical protein GB937_007465 [Aspergillus fischeri]